MSTTMEMTGPKSPENDGDAPSVVEVSDREERAVDDYTARLDARRPAPPLEFKENENGDRHLVIDHPDAMTGYKLLSNALGCSSPDALHGILDQLLRTFGESDDGLKSVNTAIKTIAAIAPRDELEAMLAVQMVATHVTAMRHLKSMRTVELLTQLEVYDRSANKLMRTFAAQMEALRKHRSGGQQKVEVRHVHVNDGGQAIVGSVDARTEPANTNERMKKT